MHHPYAAVILVALVSFLIFVTVKSLRPENRKDPRSSSFSVIFTLTWMWLIALGLFAVVIRNAP